METQHKAVFIGGPKARQIMVLEHPHGEIRIPVLERSSVLHEVSFNNEEWNQPFKMNYFTYVDTLRMRDPHSIDVVLHFYTAPGISQDELLSLALMNYATQTATYHQVAEKI